jgi:hypothetical protein
MSLPKPLRHTAAPRPMSMPSNCHRPHMLPATRICRLDNRGQQQGQRSIVARSPGSLGAARPVKALSSGKQGPTGDATGKVSRASSLVGKLLHKLFWQDDQPVVSLHHPCRSHTLRES